jgi:hypothetical protein
MPYNLTFHTFIENKPEHGQRIIFMRKTNSFGFYGFEPKSVEVEYCWFEYHKSYGVILQTGNQCRYDPGDDEAPEADDGRWWELHIMADGYVVDAARFEHDYLWIDEDEYYRSLPYINEEEEE